LGSVCLPAVSPADSEHGDRYRRDLRSLHEALDAERCAIEEFSAELERSGAAALARTEDAIERVGRVDAACHWCRGPDPVTR
jgi:hypothetical protein